MANYDSIIAAGLQSGLGIARDVYSAAQQRQAEQLKMAEREKARRMSLGMDAMRRQQELQNKVSETQANIQSEAYKEATKSGQFRPDVYKSFVQFQTMQNPLLNMYSQRLSEMSQANAQKQKQDMAQKAQYMKAGMSTLGNVEITAKPSDKVTIKATGADIASLSLNPATKPIAQQFMSLAQPQEEETPSVLPEVVTPPQGQLVPMGSGVPTNVPRGTLPTVTTNLAPSSFGIPQEMSPSSLPQGDATQEFANTVNKYPSLEQQKLIQQQKAEQERLDMERSRLALAQRADVRDEDRLDMAMRELEKATSKGGFSGEAKTLTDETTLRLSKFDQGLKDVGFLQKEYENLAKLGKAGFVKGRAAGAWGGLFGGDPDIEAYKNRLNAIVPGLARGVFGEVGVLTDKDVERYTKILSDPQTNPEIARKNFEQLNEKMRRGYLDLLKTYQKAGYNVSGFEEEMGGNKEQSDFNYSEIQSGETYKAPDGTWRKKK